MPRRFLFNIRLLPLVALATACSMEGGTAAPPGKTHDDLIAFFKEWRAFQRPRLVDGVPDYSVAAMASQHRDLARFQRRLAAFDTAGWSIADQVDLHIVRAEMHGLDFDHRVLAPWENNPAFYVTAFASESDQPAREGHFAWGNVELWAYPSPLDSKGAAEVDSGLRRIPALLAQARVNLAGDGADLWAYGIRSIRRQSAALTQFAERLPDSLAQLRSTVDRARAATDSFAMWVEGQVPTKKGPSGIGVENYNWYLRNVQLLPYTWADEVTLMERELARSHAFLALEEHRNAGLPEPMIVSSAEEHAQRFNAAVTEYMKFLDDRQILTVKDYMDAALRARIGRFSSSPREFFTEVDYRDPMVMRTHGYHWFDKGWFVAEAPRANPIRSVPLLYNMFITRTEGHATGWEEMMLQAGMFDRRPRSRELIYVLVAQRAARALGDLRMHSNEKTIEAAAAFTSANTPRGWLSLQGNLVRSEQHLYLQQPAYGTSYLIGKIEIERLIAQRRRQLGDAFTLRAFMDEFNAAGQIPISLIHWQLTSEQPAHLKHPGEGALAAPMPIAPVNGSVFHVHPRTTLLRWQPVEGATHYAVEVDFLHCGGQDTWCGDSAPLARNMYSATRIRKTEHKFDFVGAQPGRWRVWALGRRGAVGPKSDWWEFRYTK